LSEQSNTIQIRSALNNGLGYEKLKSFYPTTKSAKIRQVLQFIGPAFIVSVAYIDPPIFVLEHHK
jgi:hypothetical protein